MDSPVIKRKTLQRKPRKKALKKTKKPENQNDLKKKYGFKKQDTLKLRKCKKKKSNVLFNSQIYENGISQSQNFNLKTSISKFKEKNKGSFLKVNSKRSNAMSNFLNSPKIKTEKQTDISKKIKKSKFNTVKKKITQR